jgi:hypothetical protein
MRTLLFPPYRGGIEGGRPTARKSHRALRLVLALLCLVAACARRDKPPPEPNPYVVTIDTTAWIHALRTDDLFQSEPAVAGLTALGPAVIPALEVAMGCEPAQARVEIVEVLDQLGVPETLPLLLRAAADPDAEVRADALRALGNLKDERGRSAVEAALGDADPAVVRSAASVCGDLCVSQDAIESLVRHALRGIGEAQSSLTRILEASEQERATAAREALRKIALPVVEAGTTPEERVKAALLVLPLSSDSAVSALRSYAREGSSDPLRAEALLALAGVGAPEDVEIASKFRDSPTPGYFARVGCIALARMSARGINQATEALRDCPASLPPSR